MSLRDYYSYLYALEHSKSIDNSFLSHSSLSVDEELGLFDEIERITKHLFKLTVPGALPAKDEIQSVNNSSLAEDFGNVLQLPEHDTANSNIVRSTTAASCAIKKQTTISDDTMSPVRVVNGVGNDTCEKTSESKDIDIHMKLDEDNNSRVKINGTQQSEETLKSQRPFANIIDRLTSPTSIRDGFDFTTSIVHWPVSTRRTKFRVNQMSSRDVPIIRDCKPAKLQKQHAIDASDVNVMVIDSGGSGVEQHSTISNSTNFKCSGDGDKSCTARESTTKYSMQRSFMQNSSSIDCGQLSVEQRSMNMFRSIFELHASTGQTVRKMQSYIESKQTLSSESHNHHNENWIKNPTK